MAFDTSVLEQASTKRKSRQEADRQALLTRVISTLYQPARSYPFTQGIIFGSLIQPGRFHENSDIDIAVIDLPGEHFFALAAFLGQVLERDIDLLELDKVHFADKIRRKGLLWTMNRCTP